MSNRQKGMHTERRAVKELEVQGWLVYQVKGSTRFNKNVDIFGLFDILALRPAEEPGSHRYWIQVKTNKKLYGKDLDPFKKFKSRYCNCNDSVEIWSWFNRKGWSKKII